MIVTPNSESLLSAARHSTTSSALVTTGNTFQAALANATTTRLPPTQGKVATETRSPAQLAFDAYMNKTPVQRMRDAILKELGLTEDDLKALPPEQQASIEETIGKKIRERLLAHSTDSEVPAGNQSAVRSAAEI